VDKPPCPPPTIIVSIFVTIFVILPGNLFYDSNNTFIWCIAFNILIAKWKSLTMAG
jgi:hypothetical protein